MLRSSVDLAEPFDNCRIPAVVTARYETWLQFQRVPDMFRHGEGPRSNVTVTFHLVEQPLAAEGQRDRFYGG